MIKPNPQSKKEDPAKKIVDVPNDQKVISDLIAKIKENSGRVSIETFMAFKNLAICQKPPKEYHTEITTRKVEYKLIEKSNAPARGGKGNYQNNRGGQYNKQQQDNKPRGGYNNYNNNQQDDGFKKGTVKQEEIKQGGGGHKNYYPPREENNDPLFVRESDDFKKKLLKESLEAIQKAKQEKSKEQEIKLILNVIAPDNFEKKFSELRQIMFGDQPTKDEKGYVEGRETTINQENLKLVVQNIFRKAQTEKDYCAFYGDLCEKLIRLELALKGLSPKVSTIKQSIFRT